MARMRYLLIAGLLVWGGAGCSSSHWSVFHCSECDDFPLPGPLSQNPLTPGTYTGPPAHDYQGTTEPSESLAEPVDSGSAELLRAIPEPAPAAPEAPPAPALPMPESSEPAPPDPAAPR
jgi:hypothetical protein